MTDLEFAEARIRGLEKELLAARLTLLDTFAAGALAMPLPATPFTMAERAQICYAMAAAMLDKRDTLLGGKK